MEAPQVSGTPAVGQSLTCLRGTWSGAPAPTFTYRWLRDGRGIPSATASTHTVASEDRGASISCTVIAQNSAGVVEAASSNGVEIPGASRRTRGSRSIRDPGSGRNADVLARHVDRGAGADVRLPVAAERRRPPSATSDTYTVVSADRGLVLTCEVTASNREGTQSATSVGLHIPGVRPEDVEAPRSPALPPSASSSRACGASGRPTRRRRSHTSGRETGQIASATSATYAVELSDQGHVLSCEVIATNSEGTAEAESSNRLAVSRVDCENRNVPQTDRRRRSPLPLRRPPRLRSWPLCVPS